MSMQCRTPAESLDFGGGAGYDTPLVAGDMGKSGTFGSAQPQTVQRSKELDAFPSLVGVVLRVSWFAILLGLGMQLLLLIVAAVSGHLPNLRPVIASLVQSVSWSVIVCVGIATGTAISKLRLELTGLAGLFAAPIGFTVARSLHKGVSAALGLPVGPSGAPSPLVLGGIKAVEYGVLAVIISWIVRRGKGSAQLHALVGLCVGLFFGGIALSYIYLTNAKGMSTTDLLSRGINEILFPVGCSLVLFASEALGKHWQLASTPR